MKTIFLLFSLGLNLFVFAQANFSIGTGVSGLRNFSPQQGFWAIGQTVKAEFHFSSKQTAYASLDYYTEGKFKNNFTAFAKSPSTSPQQVNYSATGRLTFRHVSLGWKHYFKGSFDNEKERNYYATAGFGFLFARVRNNFSVDSNLYRVTPRQGENRFRKLTFDLGAGAEQPMGGNVCLFVDGRFWLPASSHTSPFLSNQKNMPLAFMLSAGLRVLFGSSY